jgi:8-oxo-dGTP diphosphatase
MPSSSQHPTRIAVAVVEHNGQFLIGQRPPGVALAGLWEFPGGKAERNESVTAAAERECLEETGLTVVAVRELSRVTHEYAHGLVEVSFIACRAAPASMANPATPQAPFCWVAREDLSRYKFPAANETLIERLVEHGFA